MTKHPHRAGDGPVAKALDISEHYRRHWQGAGFKAQLVPLSKAAAISIKEVLDEIGNVTSATLTSSVAGSRRMSRRKSGSVGKSMPCPNDVTKVGM